MENFVNESDSESHSEDDFIVDLFKRGYHHLLEKILFQFPLKIILACKEVSSTWREIILHFYDTSPQTRTVTSIRF
jgi:hypothetical protein